MEMHQSAFANLFGAACRSTVDLVQKHTNGSKTLQSLDLTEKSPKNVSSKSGEPMAFKQLDIN